MNGEYFGNSFGNSTFKRDVCVCGQSSDRRKQNNDTEGGKCVTSEILVFLPHPGARRGSIPLIPPYLYEGLMYCSSDIHTENRLVH